MAAVHYSAALPPSFSPLPNELLSGARRWVRSRVPRFWRSDRRIPGREIRRKSVVTLCLGGAKSPKAEKLLKTKDRKPQWRSPKAENILKTSDLFKVLVTRNMHDKVSLVARVTPVVQTRKRWSLAQPICRARQGRTTFGPSRGRLGAVMPRPALPGASQRGLVGE